MYFSAVMVRAALPPSAHNNLIYFSELSGDSFTRRAFLPSINVGFFAPLCSFAEFAELQNSVVWVLLMALWSVLPGHCSTSPRAELPVQSQTNSLGFQAGTGDKQLLMSPFPLLLWHPEH